jgi:hypothetical protein
MRYLRFFIAGLIAFGSFGVNASDLRIELPVHCDLGRDCFIQNYFDHDPGPDWRDYGCGRQSYNGHTGTDFRLKNRRQMNAGIAVFAAAAGTVSALRDGEQDVLLGERTTPLRKDREAGNGVRIDHGGGWQTQYSHLQRNSIKVTIGEQVAAGTLLGTVGLSGKTEFPHVDFTVRKNGQPVDPFSTTAAPGCGDTTSALWSAKAMAQLAYRSGALLNSGFSDRVLSRREIESGDRFATTLSDSAEAVVFHTEVMGIRKGDVEEVRVTNPHGQVLVNRSDTADRDMAVRRVHIGKRQGATTWLPGRYSAYYFLRRGDAIVVEVVDTVEIH